MNKFLLIPSPNINPTYSGSPRKLLKNTTESQNKKSKFLSVISGELQ
jgi:hypothetical protein